MKPITMKRAGALALAITLWVVETWLLVDAAEYSLTPQVAVIPAATAALAFLPLLLADATAGVRIAGLAGSLFLAGFVFSGVLERTGGQLDTKVAAAQNSTEARKLLETELVRERARLAEAADNMKSESRRGGCGRTCKTWASAQVGIQSRIDGLVSEIQSLAPPPVADPVSARASEMLGGYVSEQSIRNWRPALQPFGFMIAIWALFGFALMTRKVKADTQADPEITIEESNVVRRYFGPDEPDRKPDTGTKKPKGGLSKAQAFDDLMQRLSNGENIPSQDALAADWNRPKQTVSDWLKDWRRIGVVPMAVQTGRCKAIIAA